MLRAEEQIIIEAPPVFAELTDEQFAALEAGEWQPDRWRKPLWCWLDLWVHVRDLHEPPSGPNAQVDADTAEIQEEFGTAVR
jgi:hypothetical protein